jgi:hypothetical protein
MTERENFLERWSRRKAEAQREADAARDLPAAPDSPAAPEESPQAAGTDRHAALETRADSAPEAPPPGAKPAFDLASLPSLDSITATTDIRAFLAPGVPQELSRAALRRAWTADPAIRNFVGLAENDWDFTNPAAVPGFGDIPPGTNIKKMIAEIFGEVDRAAERAARPEAATPAPAEPQAPAVAAESLPAESRAAAEGTPGTSDDAQPAGLAGAAEDHAIGVQTDIVQRNSNTASQQSISESSPEENRRRRQHGGALPQS